MFFKPTTIKDVLLHLLTIVGVLFVLMLFFFYGYLPAVTKHGEVIVLPKFENMSVLEAKGVIEKNKLRMVIKDTVYSTNHCAGCVVKQVPKAGSEVKENRTIYFSINAKKAPTVKINEEILSKIRRLSLVDATYNLQLLGFQIEKIDTINGFKDYVYECYVRDRKIDVGQSYPSGSKVRIEIGNGEEETDTTQTNTEEMLLNEDE